MSEQSARSSPDRPAAFGWLHLAILACLVGLGGWWVLRQETLQAQTQASPLTADQPLLAVPAQITRDSYGLYLVDAAKGTICVYQYQAGTRKLQLLASRTYRFDVQLDDWNTLPPPREIQDLVQQQRRLESLGEQAPQP